MPSINGRMLKVACTPADDLAEAVEEAFPQHPDAEFIVSFPGLGVHLGARVLAEIGDDRNRFADTRGLKAYSGSSPTTGASGQLHHCLQHGRRFDEAIAFPSSPALVLVV